MFTKSTGVTVLICLAAVAGSARAVPNYLTFSGTIQDNPEKNASIGFFGEFTNAMSAGSTYEFVFTYDPETITPDVSSGTPTQGTAKYNSGIALVSGQAGSFTDFSGWSLDSLFGSATTHRGTQDYFNITLSEGTRTVILSVNYGDDGESFAGQNAWDSPFPMPTADELNTPALAAGALFDERYYNSGLGMQVYHEWQGGAGDGDGLSATEAPEPGAAVMLAPLALLAYRRRRR